MGYCHVWIRASLAALVALLLGSGVALAQLQAGNLYGTVFMQGGEPLPGVTVTLTGVGTPEVQVTDAQGRFRFLNLAPGHYQVKAELEGFAETDESNVPVVVGRNTSIEVHMSPAIGHLITFAPALPTPD